MSNKLLIQALQEHNLPVWDKLHIILDLAEKKNNEIYPIILNFMEQPEFERCKGTLIYALENYPPEPLFEKAIDWLIHGGFDQVDNAYETIKTFSTNHQNEKWRTELLNEVLDMFG